MFGAFPLSASAVGLAGARPIPPLCVPSVLPELVANPTFGGGCAEPYLNCWILEGSMSALCGCDGATFDMQFGARLSQELPREPDERNHTLRLNMRATMGGADITLAPEALPAVTLASITAGDFKSYEIDLPAPANRYLTLADARARRLLVTPLAPGGSGSLASSFQLAWLSIQAPAVSASALPFPFYFIFKKKNKKNCEATTFHRGSREKKRKKYFFLKSRCPEMMACTRSPAT